MNVNPYSPPIDPNQSSGVTADRTLFNRSEEEPYRICDFQLDASIAGIRARRASPMHGVFDVSMVLGTLTLIASFFLSSYVRVSFFCMAFPLWFFLGIVWLANFTFRRGDDFAATCPGLIGKVTGRFSLRQIEVHGPEVCMACEVTGKEVCETRRGIAIKIPGTEQVLEIKDQDIVQTVPSVDGRWWDEVGSGLLGETGRQQLGNQKVMMGERQLHGRDLVGLSPHRRHRNQTAIVGLLIGAFTVTAFLIYLQIPPGVFDYGYNDVKRELYDRMIVAVYCLAIFCLPLAAFGIQAATKRHRIQGSYNIIVSQAVVSVSKISQRDRAGLRAAGLKQVYWTDHGLQILGKKERLLFLMPSHWFDEDQRTWLAESFDKRPEPILRDCYFGPRL